MALMRPALGLCVAAAMLALLAVAPAPQAPTDADVPHLAPWRPSPQTRFASALRALGEEPHATSFEAGVLQAVMRPIEPADLPRLRVDAAIAASRVRRTCHCGVLRYRVIDDRLLQEHQELLAAGRAAPVEEGIGDLDDTRWTMDGATDAQVSRRARDLVRTAVPSPSTRVTFTIVRDGRVVFAFAYRPGTDDAVLWAAPGIGRPRVPPPAKADWPQTPFSGAA